MCETKCQIPNCGCPSQQQQPTFKFGDKLWHKDYKWVIYIRPDAQTTNTSCCVTPDGGYVYLWNRNLSLTKPKKKVTRSVQTWVTNIGSQHLNKTTLSRAFGGYNNQCYSDLKPITLTWEEEVDSDNDC